jgi:uncharacterized repeat protein (TIGR03803 family)
VSASQTSAQNFTVLHTFSSESDGANPFSGLVVSGTNLYGTAQAGGSSGVGAIFRIGTNGTLFTNLYSFTAPSGPVGTNSDGTNPRAGIIISGNTLYGTAGAGGIYGKGTIYALNGDGTDFRTLHSFTDAAIVQISGLLLSSNILYGTTDGGGAFGVGAVFSININGTGFTNLYNFTAPPGGPPFNSDGTYPLAALIASGNTLYGTTGGGGTSGQGTVFRVNTDGTGFTNLHSFTGAGGGDPNAGLIISGDTLYGTTDVGGSLGNGTVFGISTNGTGFQILHNFSGSDGGYPGATFFSSGNTLYGTTSLGGNWGSGTVFKIHTDGTGFATLHDFPATSGPGTNTDGAVLYSSLVLSGHNLYGTAHQGGTLGNGTIFSIFIQPELAITSAGDNVILTWPTNATGFALQSTTSLLSPVWSTNSSSPVVVNGQNTVTNPVSGTQQFFRLTQ